MYFAIREKTVVGSIPTDAEKIHLVRPISTKKIKEILSRCTHLQIISASASVQKRMRPEAKSFIQKKNIKMEHAHRAGRALNLDLQKIKEIVDLKKDFLSIRKISQKTGVPKSTIHYLLKKAKRLKVKKGKQVVYV